MNNKKSWIKHLDFILIDIFSVEFAYVISYFLRHDSFNMRLLDTIYVNIAAVLFIFELLYALMRNDHHGILRRSKYTELRSVLINNVYIWIVVVLYIFITKHTDVFSRAVFLEGFALSTVVMYLLRLIWKRVIRINMRHGDNLPKLLVVTTVDRASRTVKSFRARSYSGYKLVGLALVGEDATVLDIDGIDVVCHRENLEEYLLNNVIDDVLINLNDDYAFKFDVINTILKAGPQVHVGLDYNFYDLPNSYLENMGGYAVLTSWVSSATPFQLGMKRLMDILGGLVGCILTGIVYLFVAPAIRKASPGPVFFAQERVGVNGRRFKMYKFRSMYLDAEERKKELMDQNEMDDNFMFKIENDPRIIGSEAGPGKGIGNFIRKTSLDEFPQFLNVLKGDMSLVGTRPPTISEVELYDLHHKVRLSMKPGITGMWQVSGRNDITDFEEIVQLDEDYIANWSIGLDIKILAKTVGAVFNSEGK